MTLTTAPWRRLPRPCPGPRPGARVHAAVHRAGLGFAHGALVLPVDIVGAYGLALLHEATGWSGGLGWAAVLRLLAARWERHRAHAAVASAVTAVAVVGQRSLTCYLAQSVVFTLVFAPYAGGLGASLGVTGAAGVGGHLAGDGGPGRVAAPHGAARPGRGGAAPPGLRGNGALPRVLARTGGRRPPGFLRPPGRPRPFAPGSRLPPRSAAPGVDRSRDVRCPAVRERPPHGPGRGRGRPGRVPR